MRLRQVAYHLWLAAYSQLSTQYLEKPPLDRLRACIAFIITKVQSCLAGEETNHQRSHFAATLGLKELTSFAAEHFGQHAHIGLAQGISQWRQSLGLLPE